jgi:predicted RNA-binding protein Jag
MISLTEMQEVISRQLEEDKKVRSIEVTGDTLEEAVSNAALELGIGVRRVEFETLERGSPGFIGVGRKEWKIQIGRAHV